LDQLIELLELKKKQPNSKIIIFTTFGDTAEYLFEQITKRGFTGVAMVTGKGATVSGESRRPDFEPVLERFAPFTKLYKEKDWSNLYVEAGNLKDVDFESWKQVIEEHDQITARQLSKPIDILIATDCLSEGQNLQDADMLVNYDIHWNPVRLIQRMGRIDRLGSPNQEIQGVNFWPSQDLEDYLNLRNRVEHRLASMLLMHTEVGEVSDKLEQLKSENPLISVQEKKLYELMQESWDGIDAGPGTFGLNDLSLEAFRQELLDELNQERKKYEAMPNGVFSGVKLRNDLFVNGLPSGLIGLLGYPRRPDLSEDWKYDEHYLAYADQEGKQHILTRHEVLQILRSHKLEPIGLSDGLKSLQKSRLNELQGYLNVWMENKSGKSQFDLLESFKNPDFIPVKSEEERLLEEKFKLENFDLIAWMELN
ncbi:MAG TPA: C-terminal helicase domain-containing protein, partial [Catalimonadaceae bacterium]|nr:C-terminal helicase domain-containing protein [Catalimonadaceae bacterium]